MAPRVKCLQWKLYVLGSGPQRLQGKSQVKQCEPETSAWCPKVCGSHRLAGQSTPGSRDPGSKK